MHRSLIPICFSTFQQKALPTGVGLLHYITITGIQGPEMVELYLVNISCSPLRVKVGERLIIVCDVTLQLQSIMTVREGSIMRWLCTWCQAMGMKPGKDGWSALPPDSNLKVDSCQGRLAHLVNAQQTGTTCSCQLQATKVAMAVHPCRNFCVAGCTAAMP